MNVDYDRIRTAMLLKKLSMGKLSKEIGISVSSLSRKLSGKTEFSVSEANKMCNALEINPVHVFFAAEIPKPQQSNN